MTRFYGATPDYWLGVRSPILTAFVEMMPILKARESLANINEAVIANNRKANDRAYRQLERQATLNQIAAPISANPEVQKAIFESMGFRVVIE